MQAIPGAINLPQYPYVYISMQNTSSLRSNHIMWDIKYLMSYFGERVLYCEMNYTLYCNIVYT